MFTISKDKIELVEQMINQGTLPKYLYKYYTLNEFTEKVIIENSIWFGSAKDFNDPFDCQLVCLSNYEKNDILEYVNYNVKTNSDKKIILDQIKRNPNSFNKTVQDKISEHSNKTGITCFTTTNSNILMWSHYTNKHQGICLKFDLLKSLETFTVPIKVLYKADYPKFNYLKNQKDLLEFMFQTKSEHWSYEEEYRVIKPKTGTYNFDKKSLVEITFGANCKDEEVKKYIDLLKINNCKPTITYAIIGKSKFELLIKNKR